LNCACIVPDLHVLRIYRRAANVDN
jgi:hypothetical protein